MTVMECYKAAGEDYAAVLARFGSAEMVAHFCRRFLEDRSFADLTEAMERQDAVSAFRAAHTLKGICLNLGFSTLGSAASDLTERLRSGTLDGSAADYARTVSAYRALRTAFDGV